MIDSSKSLPAALELRLTRAHGRRVESPAVPIPEAGFVIGYENAALPFAPGLHVAARHAVVWPDATCWRLEPVSREMLVVLNGQKLPWGKNQALKLGDRIEVGLATVSVVSADDAEHMEWVPQAGLLPEDSDSENETVFKSSPQTRSTPCAKTSRAMVSRTGDTLHDPAGAPAGIPPAELPDSPVETQPPCMPVEPEPSDADVLYALLAQGSHAAQDLRDIQDVYGVRSAGFHTQGDTLRLLSDKPLPDILRSASSGAQGAPSPAPDDILAVLAEESARALSMEAHQGSSGASFQTEMWPAGQGTLPPVREDPFDRVSASSLEEILEGPLSIDDVLDSLRRQHPAPFEEAYPETMDTIPRPPDPLLLLAGLETPVPREPELAPVLHREHRTAGLNTPYLARAPHTEKEHSESSSDPVPQRSQERFT